MNVLAFDLGASSGKTFLGRFNGETLRLEPVHRFENGPVQLGGGLYWNFMGIYKQMLDAIGLAGRQAEGEIASFGVDSFSNDFGFIDKDGMLLAPMFCYRDERTARCRKAIEKKVSPREIYHMAGNQVALFNAAMQLASMREEKRDLMLDRAEKLLFLPDLLAYYLTGRAGCEYSIASVSQLYDYENGGWNRPLMERLDIPSRLFADIRNPGTVLGSLRQPLAQSLGVKPFDVVSVCQHDTGSAFLAAQPGEKGAVISSGTWAIVGTEAENPMIGDFGYRHNIANEGSLPGHHRLLCSLMGNWILQEMRQEYQKEGQNYSFAELEQLAEQEKPLQWFFDVDDEAFFAPGQMREKIRQKCTVLFGTAPETPGQFTRCVCESMALKSLWTIEKIEKLVGYPMPRISIVGGGSRDALTCRLIADAAARPVLAGPADASALGNILVQLMAKGKLAGVAEGRELLRRSFPPVEYWPQNTAAWRETYGLFREKLGLAL